MKIPAQLVQYVPKKRSLNHFKKTDKQLKDHQKKILMQDKYMKFLAKKKLVWVKIPKEK